MKSIQEQIEALTQELSPYPTDEKSYYYLGSDLQIYHIDCISKYFIPFWRHSLFASTNKAEVEEYADCYKRLKLYQLLGKKAEKEFTLKWLGNDNYATDFNQTRLHYPAGYISSNHKICVLGGVWFARNEDRLEAIKICSIDKSFQEKCTKFGLGGA